MRTAGTKQKRIFWIFLFCILFSVFAHCIIILWSNDNAGPAITSVSSASGINNSNNKNDHFLAPTNPNNNHNNNTNNNNTNNTSSIIDCQKWQRLIQPMPSSLPLSQSAPPPSGLVVTLLVGDSVLPYLKSYLPTQLRHFVLPHATVDVLLVVAGGGSKSLLEDIRTHVLLLGQHNHNHNNNDNGTNISNASSPSSSSSSPWQFVTTQTWQNLDGSNITTEEYRYNNHGRDHNNNITATTKIYLAQIEELSFPEYLQEHPNKNTIAERIEPEYCREPLEYIQGTRWYVNDMLQLGILQRYDYFIKIDADVLFYRPVPFHVLHDMKQRGSVFAHTAKYPLREVGMIAVCADEITTAVEEYLQQEKTTIVPNNNEESNNNNDDRLLSLCSRDHFAVSVDSDYYYTNFIVGNTRFFLSPEVRRFARYVSEYPHGFFEHRWTDQVFWHFALGMFIGPAFEEVVADYTNLRCFPERNCWMSSHDPERFGTLGDRNAMSSFDRCDNNGTFVHSKNIPYHQAQQQKQNGQQKKEEIIKLVERRQMPYKNDYVHDCRNSKWRYKALNV